MRVVFALTILNISWNKMMKFDINQTPLQYLQVITRTAIKDPRGLFSRLYSSQLLCMIDFDTGISQINFSHTTKKGTARGFHYQAMPYSDAKIVACVRGAVWDVAVDVRKNSTTFLKWHAEELSAKNNKMMLIPPGFAHGFQALTDDVELIYLHSKPYLMNMERSLNIFDPKLSIPWPLHVVNLSGRDTDTSFINEDFEGEYFEM